VFLANKTNGYDKVISNMHEVKARDGIIIAIASESDKEIKTNADHVVYVPDVAEPFVPIINVIPLQLLAYHIAVLKGHNPDQPRNLAKSVTVE
jgi:glucosamine--fructose-6-phosphate aminotransferase (isomerizing)